jgi:hypothetical protein
MPVTALTGILIIAARRQANRVVWCVVFAAFRQRRKMYQMQPLCERRKILKVFIRESSLRTNQQKGARCTCCNPNAKFSHLFLLGAANFPHCPISLLAVQPPIAFMLNASKPCMNARTAFFASAAPTLGTITLKAVRYAQYCARYIRDFEPKFDDLNYMASLYPPGSRCLTSQSLPGAFATSIC